MSKWAVPVLASILILGSLGFTQQAFSDGTVDQQNLINEGGAAGIGENTGQTFTPTVDNLIAVDVILRNTCSDTWTVNIREGSGFGGAIVGTTSYVVDTSSTLTQHIDFSSSVPLIPGNLYMLHLNSPTQVCKWLGSGLNPYPGGSQWLGIKFANNDADFATYFADFSLVVGGTSIPIDTTSLLLAPPTLPRPPLPPPSIVVLSKTESDPSVPSLAV